MLPFVVADGISAPYGIVKVILDPQNRGLRRYRIGPVDGYSVL